MGRAIWFFEKRSLEKSRFHYFLIIFLNYYYNVLLKYFITDHSIVDLSFPILIMNTDSDFIYCCLVIHFKTAIQRSLLPYNKRMIIV